MSLSSRLRTGSLRFKPRHATSAEQGIGDPQSLRISFGDRIPDITKPQNRERLADLVAGRGDRVVALDPLYLALGGGEEGGRDVNNMFFMGPVLESLTACLRAAGLTAILVHHTTKTVGRRNCPMELSDLAHAGIGQFARQWLLLSRRGRLIE